MRKSPTKLFKPNTQHFPLSQYRKAAASAPDKKQQSEENPEVQPKEKNSKSPQPLLKGIISDPAQLAREKQRQEQIQQEKEKVDYKNTTPTLNLTN